MSNLIVSFRDNRFNNVGEYESKIEYNMVEKSDFHPCWPSDAKVEDHRDTIVVKKGEKGPMPIKTGGAQVISEELLDEWGSFVLWDKNQNKMAPVTRDQVGEYFKETGIDPELEKDIEIDINGEKIRIRTTFSLIKQYLADNFDLDSVSKVTWAPKEAIVSLAKQISDNKGQTLIAVGMGPN